MLEGLIVFTVWPVGESCPEAWSTPRQTMVSPARIEMDVVRMRAGLPGPMRSGVAGERDEIARWRERSVRADRQDRDGPRGVVRNNQEAIVGSTASDTPFQSR